MRESWLKVLVETVEPGCEIGMESCGGAHHWARRLQTHGFKVRLVAPQFVKPYVKSNKNDANALGWGRTARGGYLTSPHPNMTIALS
jgi:transposase